MSAETTCSERCGAMGVRGANCRANSQSTRPDHQCPARGRGPQRCMDAYKVRTRRDSGTAARWFLIRFLECVLINAGIGRMSASLIGRLGQALSGYPATPVRCRSRARASLRTRHQGPSIMGFEDEVEQSLGRPCRQCNGRLKRTYELL